MHVNTSVNAFKKAHLSLSVVCSGQILQVVRAANGAQYFIQPQQQMVLQQQVLPHMQPGGVQVCASYFTEHCELFLCTNSDKVVLVQSLGCCWVCCDGIYTLKCDLFPRVRRGPHHG